MLLVYIENGIYSEQIATFESEEIYSVCIESLEKYAKENGWILTESEIEQI